MFAGVIVDDTTAVHIHHRTAEAIGVKCGDFLELRHRERDTVIVRRCCCCEGPGMRENYAYLDRQSFHYLDGQLHDEIWVKEAEWPMEMP
jgi:hypothetical protein